MDTVAEFSIANTSIDKLAEALAKAQGKIIAPLKNRVVDFTDKNGRRVKYNYADLADVIDCIRTPLSENGLSLFHTIEQDETLGFGMRTTLLHSSGQKLTTFYPLPSPSSMRPQEFGSSLTYGRRYSVSLIIGVASEEDDDGAIAASPAPAQVKNKINERQAELAKSKDEAEFSQVALTPLGELNRFVKEKKMPGEVIKSIMARVTGTDKLSTEMTNEELQKVLDYLKLMK